MQAPTPSPSGFRLRNGSIQKRLSVRQRTTRTPASCPARASLAARHFLRLGGTWANSESAPILGTSAIRKRRPWWAPALTLDTPPPFPKAAQPSGYVSRPRHRAGATRRAREPARSPEPLHPTPLPPDGRARLVPAPHGCVRRCFHVRRQRRPHSRPVGARTLATSAFLRVGLGRSRRVDGRGRRQRGCSREGAGEPRHSRRDSSVFGASRRRGRAGTMRRSRVSELSCCSLPF